jgi:hypothetical protein
LNYNRLQKGGYSNPLKRAEEKTKKPQNSPKGLTVSKAFTVPEPLNILRLKTRILNTEGDNKQIK